MESASIMRKMSFGKTLRNGQLESVNKFSYTDFLNVQLPTGYGKTLTACCCYAVKKKQSKANRLFVVFPTDNQLIQFENDAPQGDLKCAGIEGPMQVVDCRFFGTEAIKKHRNNTAQVFVTTIQSLIKRTGADVAHELFKTGQWMAVVDEYQHYGTEKEWGKTILSFNFCSRLAMSATPTRPDDDSAFGAPDVEVRYRDAVKEKAVKPLTGNSYVYRIDLLDDEGEITSLTTNELVSIVGSSSPDAVEKYTINRKMRWSPKYASPLVSIPINRMIKNRVDTGYKLQVLIGALCVSHAEIVCKQVSSLFPHLSVDWVGTGENGRSQNENRKVLQKFCPPKVRGTRPDPDLDILVHVGMAGEGLDSILVSEIVHLNAASVNNTNDQENGRASRYIEGVVGNINFDSSSGYAKEGYIGAAIMDAMDGNDPNHNDEDEDEGNSKENNLSEDLPEEPGIRIFNMELESIDSGDIGVQTIAKALIKLNYINKSLDELNEDRTLPEWSKIIAATKNVMHIEADEHNEKSIIAQWKEQVKNALGHVANIVIKRTTSGRFNTTQRGDIMKRINSRKKRSLGGISNSIGVYKAHYNWLRNLQQEITKTNEVPEWLE